MATYTPFLNLEKPTTSERLDVLKINANWDKIDEGVSSLNSKFANVGYVAPISWEPTGTEASVTSGTAVDIATVSDLIPSGAAAKGVILYSAYGNGNYDYAGTLMLVSGKVRYMPRYTQSNIHVYGAIIYTK